MPFEASVKAIVFAKQVDRKLSDPAYLARYAGEYELSGETMTVRVQGETLIVDQKGARAMELVPARDDEFTVKKSTGVSVRFMVSKDGKVDAMALSVPQGVFTAKRKS